MKILFIFQWLGGGMANKEIYSERFENFWQKYGADERLNTAKKGTKFTAWESWNKSMKKWAKLTGAVETGLQLEVAYAQAVARGYESDRRNRQALRAAKEFCPALRMCSTYLNQMGFMDVHEHSTSELRTRRVEMVCKCGSTDIISGNPKDGIEPICKACDIELWAKTHYTQPGAHIRKMLKQYPVKPNEAFIAWCRRVGAMLGASVVKTMKPVVLPAPDPVAIEHQPKPEACAVHQWHTVRTAGDTAHETTYCLMCGEVQIGA